MLRRRGPDAAPVPPPRSWAGDAHPQAHLSRHDHRVAHERPGVGEAPRERGVAHPGHRSPVASCRIFASGRVARSRQAAAARGGTQPVDHDHDHEPDDDETTPEVEDSTSLEENDEAPEIDEVEGAKVEDDGATVEDIVAALDDEPEEADGADKAADKPADKDAGEDA